VIVITAYGSLETVTRAVRGKAFDTLVKPLDLDRAADLAHQVLASREAASVLAETARLEKNAAPASGKAAARGATMIGSSPAMQEVYKRIGKVAQSDSAVLVLGQTGTGKELVARAIHEHSARAGRPFVAVNCGALPENLVESELFGYARGAFTGADSDKVGRFEAAHGGTLFLDEMGELPHAAQVKLLRFLDTRTVERLGSVKPIHLDVRVVAATNRDLPADVRAGRFRADLYYRLAVIQIELPPLRARG
jgi:two-component system, NtrC family, response regulator AtoC